MISRWRARSRNPTADRQRTRCAGRAVAAAPGRRRPAGAAGRQTGRPAGAPGGRTAAAQAALAHAAGALHDPGCPRRLQLYAALAPRGRDDPAVPAQRARPISWWRSTPAARSANEELSEFLAEIDALKGQLRAQHHPACLRHRSSRRRAVGIRAVGGIQAAAGISGRRRHRFPAGIRMGRATGTIARPAALFHRCRRRLSPHRNRITRSSGWSKARRRCRGDNASVN